MARKPFDRDVMYRMVMRDKKDDGVSDSSRLLDLKFKEAAIMNRLTAKELNTAVAATEVNSYNKVDDEYVLYNVTERFVLDRVNVALNRMRCCKCDRCRRDIIALALNKLPPKYVVEHRYNLGDRIKQEDKDGIKVMSAVIRAVMSVRGRPRH